MTDDELRNYLDASSRLLGIEIPEVCQAGVLENLQRNFSLAEKLEAFPLPAETELAPIFIA